MGSQPVDRMQLCQEEAMHLACPAGLARMAPCAAELSEAESTVENAGIN